MTRRSDDAGMSLVEIIVAVVVASLVAGMVALVLINGLTAQQQAAARDRATGSANVASASLTQSIRNATMLRVSLGGTRLDARVLTDTGTAECRAWAMVGADLRYSAGPTPRSAATNTWKPIATGVTATLPGDAAFAPEGNRGVSIGLRITHDRQTAIITDGATAQAQDDAAGGPPC
ncbi:hypothetical protein H9651_10595 [Microbacterium sp. Sa4CUA7]|uniref:Prepilin-type N-terminal cleavage/methylation domain-containing protein n=1 Tax=Microbacterium pullorum TaxID=2762236 RepID=A0ABR8S3Q7_9MICO|nr:hypothetical protein [Microbacterium pullorum]MBD7958088.1 hypothetical protein [Microbacterium pullorum]